MDPKIKTRPDGSIDTAYYMERGHEMRSEQAHFFGRLVGRHILGWFRGLRDGAGPALDAGHSSAQNAR